MNAKATVFPVFVWKVVAQVTYFCVPKIEEKEITKKKSIFTKNANE